MLYRGVSKSGAIISHSHIVLFAFRRDCAVSTPQLPLRPHSEREEGVGARLCVRLCIRVGRRCQIAHPLGSVVRLCILSIGENLDARDGSSDGIRDGSRSLR